MVIKRNKAPKPKLFKLKNLFFDRLSRDSAKETGFLKKMDSGSVGEFKTLIIMCITAIIFGLLIM